MNNLVRTSSIKLGEHRGSPRIYMQGQWLARVGFIDNARYAVEIEPGCVTLKLDDDADRMVSAKGVVPVIDINSRELAQALHASDKLTVVARHESITISRSHTAQLVTQRELKPTEGSLFSGGGLLSQAAKEAGFDPVFAVEIDSKYADIYSRNHPEATVFNTSVEDVDIDHLRQFRPLGLLTLGIPCQPFSRARTLDRGGQTKRDQDIPPEAHELGDMIVWGLRAVEAANPHTVVVEESDRFLGSSACWIWQHAMRRLGYNVDARIMNALDYGCLTSRKRTVVIATTDQPVRWPEASVSTGTISDILDSEVPESEWFDRDTKAWLYDHWDAQNAKGNGFASQVYRHNATHLPTIKKRYFAQQGDNPVLAHPTREGVHRWFTLSEVKRLHGIPEDYYLGDAKTVAGEVMGQGVVVPLFTQIIRAATQQAQVLAKAA